MTKLIIQIPCYNESETLAVTLKALPDRINGIDEIEILVIDDGSTDNSVEIAEQFGAKVFKVGANKGLANAFRTGIRQSLLLGADIIVNTDADNQYCANDIEKIVQPILEKQADMVVGARDIFKIKEFSFLKKVFQKCGSAFLKLLSSTKVEDAPSGFRAFSKEAAVKINVFDNYTYTMETLIQAGAKGLRVLSVPISTNKQMRKSRLVKNVLDYILKSAKTAIRMFIIYRPFRFFTAFAALFGILGLFLVIRFVYFYAQGFGNGHIQSLIFASIFLIFGVQLEIIAVLGDLISINRKLLEDIQTRIKITEINNTK